MTKFDVNAILDKADLLQYVERAGGKLRKHGERYSCECPLHGGDNPTAFSIWRGKDGRLAWNCYTGACGGGDSIRFVEKWLGYDFKRACEFIGGEHIEDAQAMKESAEQRLEAARIETIAAQQREEARRNELRVAEKHLQYNENLRRVSWLRDEWRKAGIDDGMQDFWNLGGCEDFTYKYDDETYHTPTLTIPIFNTENELMTIQHRLLQPKNPKDKYRPERTGLHSHPFLALPTMGYQGGIIWVMEGAKKAMVTWTRSDADWQCIGVASQGEYKNLVDVLAENGKSVIVVPDPNSERNPNAFRLGRELAHAIGGKVLRVPEKIDDYILSADLSQNDLYALSKQARKA